MAKKRFKPLTIKSKEQLGDFLDFCQKGEICAPLIAREIRAIVQFFDVKSDKGRLLAWARKHEVDICDQGIRRIIASKGEITSWKQYFEKHWKDLPFKGWLSDNLVQLCDFSMYVDPWMQYKEFLRQMKREQGSWLPWPFPPKRRTTRRQPR